MSRRQRLTACTEPGCPTLTDSTRCPPHAREQAKARGTRQQRGYDAEHDRLRRAWAPRVNRGEVDCARCHQRIQPGDDWHLGHTDDRTAWTGPEHPYCNLSAAGRAAHAGH